MGIGCLVHFYKTFAVVVFFIIKNVLHLFKKKITALIWLLESWGLGALGRG